MIGVSWKPFLGDLEGLLEPQILHVPRLEEMAWIVGARHGCVESEGSEELGVPVFGGARQLGRGAGGRRV